MKFTAPMFALVAIVIALPGRADAHCQVPCGIYGDQRRFEQMLEDTQTIAKAITEVGKIAEGGEMNPQTINQAVRWVTTKEDHATSIQRVIGDYFMAQRIKPGTNDEENKAYVKKLTAAHTVMTAAMKAKQQADPKAAEALKASILDFYRAYEGKEPKLDHDD